jgi:hypothetical protein
LAAGGTAVGTGLNAPPGFGEEIAAELAELTGLPLKTAPNKFAAQGSLDGMVAVSAGLRGVAVALMKIANDMRWLASGPRAGLHELKLPASQGAHFERYEVCGPMPRPRLKSGPWDSATRRTSLRVLSWQQDRRVSAIAVIGDVAEEPLQPGLLVTIATE